jgi:multicomponent Na+:H+ antiporter subunit D
MGLAITIFAGPLYTLTDRAAVDLLGQTSYINAVLTDGERGEGESIDAVAQP